MRESELIIGNWYEYKGEGAWEGHRIVFMFSGHYGGESQVGFNFIGQFRDGAPGVGFYPQDVMHCKEVPFKNVADALRGHCFSKGMSSGEAIKFVEKYRPKKNKAEVKVLTDEIVGKLSYAKARELLSDLDTQLYHINASKEPYRAGVILADIRALKRHIYKSEYNLR